jgi:hypothetical protein
VGKRLFRSATDMASSVAEGGADFKVCAGPSFGTKEILIKHIAAHLVRLCFFLAPCVVFVRCEQTVPCRFLLPSMQGSSTDAANLEKARKLVEEYLAAKAAAVATN